MNPKELIDLEKALSLIMNKPPVEKIEIVNDLKLENIEAAGKYVEKDKTIYLSQTIINKYNLIVIVLAHESRHSYQWRIIKEKQEDKYDNRFKEIWKKEFDKYSCDEQDNHFQNIEIDAQAFSFIISEIIFNKKSRMNNFPELDKMIQERKKEILKRYNKDIISKILNTFKQK